MRKIIQTIRNRPIIFSITFILFISITSLLNKTYLTIPNFFSSYKPIFSVPFTIINWIIIPFLVATTIVLSIERVSQLNYMSNKKGLFGVFGTFIGLLSGACPGCFVGLLPAFLGIFGITASIGNLPLNGFEIGLISIIFLSIAIYYLSKENVCKIKPKFYPKDLS